MISNYLKEYFKQHKISQYEIAKEIGLSQEKISLSFNSKRKLTADELISIAIKFNINLEDIKKDIKI